MSPLARVFLILAVAAATHLVVRGALGILRDRLSPRRHPKIATLASLLGSAAIFALWFTAVGLVLAALEIELTAYLATATVIGLAVGFGSQGLVQDVVIGLTLIFTDALDVGDTVEVSGQVGRVESIGLRFTTLTNFLGQTVFIPNRNIAVVGRYRRGVVRAYVDVQVPDGAGTDQVAEVLHSLARGFRAQHPAAVISDPDPPGRHDAGPGGWTFLRLRLRLWPGQQPLIDGAFRQRVLARMKAIDEHYAEWMVTVTYRDAERDRPARRRGSAAPGLAEIDSGSKRD